MLLLPLKYELELLCDSSTAPIYAGLQCEVADAISIISPAAAIYFFFDGRGRHSSIRRNSSGIDIAS